ncbi:MAG: trehalose-phosphatase [Deltaproteobacteria bacterium]|nr:trehalose-phosphatase [Deltaproteobacteria bacterium]
MDYIKNRITGKRISLFLDFDGTLTPIVSRPEKAFLSYQMKEIVRRLCNICKVAIVSGREIGDIKERVGIPECIYVGNHGLEVEGNGLSFKVEGAVESRGELEKFLREIREAVREGNIRGAVLEDKKLTASLHYRLMDKIDIEAFLSLIRSALKPYLEKGLFRIVEGKKVVEVRPNVGWDKGKAGQWLMMQEGFKESIPVYIGDDETDRDAFRAIKGQGVSLAVGPMLEGAEFHLRGQGEVEKLLRWMMSLLSK